MPELKPCPFCGGKGMLRKRTKWGNNNKEFEYFVSCGGDHVTCPAYYGGVYKYDSAEAAIAAWNRRANDGDA